MPIPEPTPWYVPPAFPLFEFDDTQLAVDADVPARRWFPHFNGKVGQPADEVQLGWRHLSGRQVVVGTMSVSASSTSVHTSGRGSAVLMVLGGLQLWIPNRVHVGGEEFNALSNRASSDAGPWVPSPIIVDGGSFTSYVTALVGAVAGYTVAGERLLTFAAVGLDPTQIRLRAMGAPSAEYAIDPTEPHSTKELEQEWQDFFRDNPQARPRP